MTICSLHASSTLHYLNDLELELFITIRLDVLCKSIFISSFTILLTLGPSWRDSTSRYEKRGPSGYIYLNSIQRRSRFKMNF